MREKMLVLGIAEPYRSKKYEVAVCVAGITIHGDFRRIYSIPLKDYYRNPFKKFQYIRYEALGKGSDFRRESRKIDMKSIEPLKFASPSTVAEKIREFGSTSLEYLRNRTKSTLGIVKPQIDSFYGEYRDYPRTVKYSRPRSSKRAIKLPRFRLKFDFSCQTRSCSEHKIICQDIEIGNYYRRLLNQIHDRETYEKVEERMNNFLEETTPYFLMGTHRRYVNAWLIISIINSQAKHFYAYRRRES